MWSARVKRVANQLSDDPNARDLKAPEDEAASLLEALDARIRAIVAEELEKRSPDNDQWLTIKQVKGLTGLSEWTIRQLIAEGKLPVFQPNPGKPPLRIMRGNLRLCLEGKS
jgi:hypothetical protein